MDKKKLRRLMKDQLSKISESSINDRSLLIAKNLYQLLSDQNIIQQKILVGAFAAIESEPRLDWFFSKTEHDGLSAFPFFDEQKKEMVFKKASLSELTHNLGFGPKILAPGKEAPEVEPGLLVIPGLGFDLHGQRLGRGKGFYDRYLDRFKGLKVGVCFTEQLIDTIPTEVHDVPMDYIVTEEKIIKCDKSMTYKRL